jgi:hypothetical protein
MTLKAVATAALLLCSLTSGWAQPRLSLGITGGLQVHPSPERVLPLIGVSAWYKTSDAIFLSGEYLRYQGVDLYPTAPAGLLPARVHENSRTQRLSIGVHYLIKTYNTSSKVLLGINLGQSWDKRGYQLYEPAADGSFNFRGNSTDHLQRAVSFASLTALSQNKKLPFFLQTRYGHSFTGFFNDTKSFWQVVAGLHWGIL